MRRARTLVVLVVLAATALLATAGAATGSSGGGGRFRPGAPGVGDDYFPLDGNGGYDVRHYLLRVSYEPATDRLVGVATVSARATQNLSRFNLGLRWADRPLGQGERPPGELVADRPRADRHPPARPAQGPALHHRGPLRRRPHHPGAGGRPWLHHRGRVHPHRRRRPGRRPARGGGQLVPGQRPPDRQGVLHLRHHRTGRPGGGRQRPPAGPRPPWWEGHLGLERPRADGLVPGHDGHRAVPDPPLPHRRRAVDVRRGRPRPVRRAGRPRGPRLADLRRDRAGLARPPGRDPRLPGAGLQPLPVLHRRRDRGRLRNLLFALETQTRPVYSKYFFFSPESGDSVVVHELAHQWFGDSVALAEWKHIWLNEGFAQYAEWLWAEDQGIATAQEQFDAFYNGIPADEPFWSVVIGDPGPELLFDNAVYLRGAMAVHALRTEVGDRDFYRILHAWTTRKAGGHGTVPQFIRLAERVSGEQLDDLFRVWLFTGSKPVLEGATAVRAATSAPAARTVERTGAAQRLRR